MPDHHNTWLLNNKIFKRFHLQQHYANKFLININSQKLKKKNHRCFHLLGIEFNDPQVNSFGQKIILHLFPILRANMKRMFKYYLILEKYSLI